MLHLVVGASGQVGVYLMAVLKESGIEAVGTYWADEVPGLIPLDMRRETEVAALLDRLKPQVVYVPACNPNVEWIEEHPEEAYEINVRATLSVIRQAAARKAKPVFYSSDYVFDGQNGPYGEDDPVHPLNVYGRHKLEVEVETFKATRDALILRTAVVFGFERKQKNFLYTMRRELGAGRTMRVPVDQISSPTYSRSLAEFSVKLSAGGHSGIFNVTGSDVMNRYDFAIQAANVFGWDPKLIQPITTDQLNQKAKRPLRAGMKVEKVVKATGHPALSAEEALRAFRATYKDFSVSS